MEPIERNTAAYEKWLRKRCDVVEADLDAKHRRMRKSAFDFLRATYFHWARTVEGLCPELDTGPRVPCVGDIHVENYGTWRDADSRLVWGINDFDEAAVMPYGYDLVRLATSAILMPDLQVSASEAVDAILTGYRQGLEHPRARLLDDGGDWLRSLVNPTAQGNRAFWHDLDSQPEADPPAKVRRALKASLPRGSERLRFVTRRKGGGSLGRPRFVVIATWNSGCVIREAKALVPSAWNWAHGTSRRKVSLEIAYGPYRSPDPHLHIDGRFLIRRIAPDSRKIDLAGMQSKYRAARLLGAMAADLAAVHAASGKSARIAKDLDARSQEWLHTAASAARSATEADFATYVALST